jgi:hypothetical protein
MTDMKILYARLRALPYPVLGKSIGDFALYDALLAGFADRAAKGHFINTSDIPVPGEETLSHVSTLRKKSSQSQDEVAFLEYFDVLEEIRSVLTQGR